MVSLYGQKTKLDNTNEYLVVGLLGAALLALVLLIIADKLQLFKIMMGRSEP